MSMSLAQSIRCPSNKAHHILVAILFFICFTPIAALSQNKGLEVRNTSMRIIETDPGKVITATFIVVNGSGSQRKVLESLKVPPGWILIMPQEGAPPFEIAGQSEQVRLVTFKVPASAAAGSHEIVYSTRDSATPSVTDEKSCTVVVHPVTKLELFIDEKPENVIAGEPCLVKIRVVNRGNAEAKVALNVKNSPDFPFKLEPKELTLGAGKSGSCTVQVSVDKDYMQAVPLVVGVRAETINAKGIPVIVDKPAVISVIPRTTGHFDPYHRIPVSLRLGDLGDTGQNGIGWVMSGAGSLDEEKKRLVDFYIRTPSLQRISSFGDRDEYRFNYRDSHLKVRTGDQTYTLSPLTESYKYGRGVELGSHSGPFNYGAFLLMSRWMVPGESEFAAYLNYNPANWWSLQGNYFQKYQDQTSVASGGTGYYNGANNTNIMSLRGIAAPGKKLYVEAEYGLCSSNNGPGLKVSHDKAYRIKADGILGKTITYSLEKIYAGPRYYGYYNDNDYFYGILNFPLSKQLGGYLSYRTYQNNLSLDMNRGGGSMEKSCIAGLVYTFPSGLSLSLEGESYDRKALILPALFDFAVTRTKWGVGKTFGNLGIQLSYENGELNDRTVIMRRYNLGNMRYNIYYNFAPGKSLSVYTSNGDTSFYSAPQKSLNQGAALAMTMSKKLQFNCSVDSYRTKQSGTLYENRSIYSALTYTFKDQRSLSFWSRIYQNSQNVVNTIDSGFAGLNSAQIAQQIQQTQQPQQSVFMLSYNIPLDIPVSRKKSVGVLKGRVVDADKAEKPPLPNVRLLANTVNAVSNSKGEFIFPSLAPGTYSFKVSQDSLGMNKVVSEQLPIKVEIKGGEATVKNLGIVTSAGIKGCLTIYDFEKEQMETDRDTDIFKKTEKEQKLIKRSGWEGALVELSDGKETRRQVTDEKGGFAFFNIRPGTWTLKIYEDGMPDLHRLEKDTFELPLSPGDDKELDIKVLPKKRIIRIIDNGEVKKEKDNRKKQR
ncbi:MAG: hypothetical protein AB2L14_00085 [Candidatus Xenobiia bacterium LiM19]